MGDAHYEPPHLDRQRPLPDNARGRGTRARPRRYARAAVLALASTALWGVDGTKTERPPLRRLLNQRRMLRISAIAGLRPRRAQLGAGNLRCSPPADTRSAACGRKTPPPAGLRSQAQTPMHIGSASALSSGAGHSTFCVDVAPQFLIEFYACVTCCALQTYLPMHQTVNHSRFLVPHQDHSWM